MITGFIYSILLSIGKSIHNIITKSILIPFVKTITNNSVISMMFFKHMLKFVIYSIILAAIFIYKRNDENTFKSMIKLNKIDKKILMIFLIVATVEITVSYFYYNSLIHNNLNKFILYTMIFGLITGGLISNILYKEKFSPKLLLGYIISIIGVIIVKNA